MNKTFEDDATLVSVMEKMVDEDPDKPLCIFWDTNLKRTVLTRKDTWEKSRKFAAMLRRQGIGKGDILCNTLPNSQERFITTLGTILSGAVSMHGQLFLADGEDILKNWKDSRCKGVILDPNLKKGAMSVLERVKYVDEQTGKVGYKELPCLTHILPVDLGGLATTESWFHSLDNETETYVDDSVSSDDIASIFTTSGTTGFAKLVPHTHRTLLTAGLVLGTFYNFNSESVFFNLRSFGWVGGAPLLCIIYGITRVALDDTVGMPQDLGALAVKIFNHENCDTSFLLPSDIQSIMNSLDAGNSIDRRLRVVCSGGGPLSTVSMSAVGRFTDELCVFYGSTECGLVYGLGVTDPNSYENNCVGYAAESVETKILGEDKEEVPFGETGQIFIRGPSVAKGYVNDIENSKDIFLADGWYCTSDIGHFNEKGQLFVYCRKSNAINHKGFIHYPGWMESRINSHPDIQKSIVIGIPDPVNHEDICLCIIKKPGSNDLTVEDVREFCKSLFLTSDKAAITPIPKYYFFFEAFPVNSNGKIDRKTLLAQVFKRLGK